MQKPKDWDTYDSLTFRVTSQMDEDERDIWWYVAKTPW